MSQTDFAEEMRYFRLLQSTEDMDMKQSDLYGWWRGVYYGHKEHISVYKGYLQVLYDGYGGDCTDEVLVMLLWALLQIPDRCGRVKVEVDALNSVEAYVSNFASLDEQRSLDCLKNYSSFDCEHRDK